MSSPDCPQQRPVSIRDRRIDFLRGLAVIGISANHIYLGDSYPTQYPPYHSGHVFAFNFGDVFILLSGIVVGIVVFPLFPKGGLQQCSARARRRAGQVWGVQIASALVILPLIWVFEQGLGTGA